MRWTEFSRRRLLESGLRAAALGAASSLLPPTAARLLAAQQGAPGRADWPRFGCDLRNSRFNAGEMTLGRENVERLKVKWSFDTEDDWPIQMTPAVVGDTLYFGAGRYQYALETSTGRRKWRFDWGANGEWESTAWNMNPRYRNVRSSPQFENGRLYFGTGSCAVFCIDAATGKQIWKTTLLSPEQAERMSANIYHSPVVYAGKVYIAHSGGDASIFCLDADTGAIRWKFRVAQDVPPGLDTGGGSPWTSGAIDVERGILYNGTGNNKVIMPNLGLYTESLVAHDLDTGELLWYDQVHPQDVFDLDFNAHPMVFDAEPPGRVRARSRPCVAAGNKAGIFCWDRYTGERTWKVMLGGQCTSCAAENNALATAYNRVFVQYASVASVKPYSLTAGLHAYTGDIQWSVLNSGSHSSPIAVANRVLYQGFLSGKIEALDADNGRTLWEHTLPSAYRGGMAVANGALYSSNGEAGGSRKPPVPYKYSMYCFTVDGK